MTLHTRDGNVVDTSALLAAELEGRGPVPAQSPLQLNRDGLTLSNQEGWLRFTKKVVSAAGSFDPGSIQIPQKLFHLANSLALRDRDSTLRRKGRRHDTPSEFVAPEKDTAVTNTRYLVLGTKYLGGTDNADDALQKHKRRSSSWERVHNVSEGATSKQPTVYTPPAILVSFFSR